MEKMEEGARKTRSHWVLTRLAEAAPARSGGARDLGAMLKKIPNSSQTKVVLEPKAVSSASPVSFPKAMREEPDDRSGGPSVWGRRSRKTGQAERSSRIVPTRLTNSVQFLQCVGPSLVGNLRR